MYKVMQFHSRLQCNLQGKYRNKCLWFLRHVHRSNMVYFQVHDYKLELSHSLIHHNLMGKYRHNYCSYLQWFLH